MPDYSDDEILHMLRSSVTRSQAFGWLYDDVYAYIAAFINKNGGSSTDAEDLFQDALLAFYEKVNRSDFELQGSIKNYIYGISRNLWFKRFRSGMKEIPVEDMASINSPEEDTETNDELIHLLDSTFIRLSPGCQQILRLYYYENKSMKQIAAMMTLASAGVAKNKKARCLQKMKEWYLEGYKHL